MKLNILYSMYGELVSCIIHKSMGYLPIQVLFMIDKTLLVECLVAYWSVLQKGTHSHSSSGSA